MCFWRHLYYVHGACVYIYFLCDLGLGGSQSNQVGASPLTESLACSVWSLGRAKRAGLRVKGVVLLPAGGLLICLPELCNSGRIRNAVRWEGTSCKGPARGLGSCTRTLTRDKKCLSSSGKSFSFSLSNKKNLKVSF